VVGFAGAVRGTVVVAVVVGVGGVVAVAVVVGGVEMTRDEIIRLAREAGVEFYPSPTNDVRLCLLKNLARFSALVIAAERADAERYRWLRNNNAKFSWNPSKYNQNIVSGFAAFGTGYVGFEFEEAIDKAMGKGE
jgi:hypothetical protein